MDRTQKLDGEVLVFFLARYLGCELSRAGERSWKVVFDFGQDQGDKRISGGVYRLGLKESMDDDDNSCIIDGNIPQIGQRICMLKKKVFWIIRYRMLICLFFISFFENFYYILR